MSMPWLATGKNPASLRAEQTHRVYSKKFVGVRGRWRAVSKGAAVAEIQYGAGEREGPGGL